MYPEPFMKKEKRLKILIDSSSVDCFLPNADRRSKALLKYRNNQLIDIVRTPETVVDSDLQKIVAFEKIYDENESLKVIKIKGGRSILSQHAFSYHKETMEAIGKNAYNKDQLNADEWENIELVFIQARLNRILVTSNDFLLKTNFPVKSNIVTPYKAAEIVDLFLKYHNNYPISHFMNANKGYWYLLSFRTKIPFLHFDVTIDSFEEKSILDTLAHRFKFLLMSIDKMGLQFYFCAGNDARDELIYHFNYFISLVTGIFDSLALQTCKKYTLKFKHKNQISLHNKTGKDFLKKIKEHNPELRKHIHDYVYFIQAIYILRERILHREMLRETGFENRSGGWKGNFILIPKELTDILRLAGDKQEKYEVWTTFGVYLTIFLEPYTFSKAASTQLITLCNKYLQQLGFSNFIEEMENLKPEDAFTKDVINFKRFNLGF